MREDVAVSKMLGKTLTRIECAHKGSDSVNFYATDGTVYCMYHGQDCCESVDIEDVAGDIADLIDSPLTMAEEVSNYEHEAPEGADSYTWTFYKFATVKGYVTIRWLGESNGYYSEGVNFERVK